jgi:hypothetical protein
MWVGFRDTGHAGTRTLVVQLVAESQLLNPYMSIYRLNYPL